MRWNNKSKACIVEEALKSVSILSMGVSFYIMPVSSSQIHLWSPVRKSLDFWSSLKAYNLWFLQFVPPFSLDVIAAAPPGKKFYISHCNTTVTALTRLYCDCLCIFLFPFLHNQTVRSLREDSVFISKTQPGTLVGLRNVHWMNKWMIHQQTFIVCPLRWSPQALHYRLFFQNACGQKLGIFFLLLFFGGGISF